MEFYAPGVETLDYRQGDPDEERAHERLRRRLHARVQEAALEAWEALPAAARRTLCRRALSTFESLCEVVDARTHQRAFGRMRILRQDAKRADMVRMRPEDMNPTPYTDGRLASAETMVEIVQRTINRYVNSVVHRELVFTDAETTRRDVRAGRDDELVLRRFLHVSQRAFWPRAALLRALACVDEAHQAVLVHLVAFAY